SLNELMKLKKKMAERRTARHGSGDLPQGDPGRLSLYFGDSALYRPPANRLGRAKARSTARAAVAGYAPLHPPYGVRVSCIACQMRWLVVGISMCLTPSGASASRTALTIAGNAPTVPASPAPLAPSGLSFVGHGLLSILM